MRTDALLPFEARQCFGAGHPQFATSIATDGETIYVADWELRAGRLPRHFGPDGDLYVLDHDGLAKLGGDRLIESAGQLQYPRSFLFVR